MSVLAKRILSVALLGGLLIHIAFIFIYGSPLKSYSKKVDFINTYYKLPFLTQTWSVFVPAPKATNKLFVRYQTSNGWSNWEDILNKEIMNHRSNRFSGNENLVLLLSNSLYYAVSAPPESFDGVRKENSNVFKVLLFEVNQYLKLKENLASGTPYEVIISSDNGSASQYFKLAIKP